ncbi:MAG TPA: hypothetical protein ENJ32_07970 [Crenotrichaceae bacterium]|nr:hypothetical protein [Crenotrichaceae bacterium]
MQSSPSFWSLLKFGITPDALSGRLASLAPACLVERAIQLMIAEAAYYKAQQRVFSRKLTHWLAGS